MKMYRLLCLLVVSNISSMETVVKDDNNATLAAKMLSIINQQGSVNVTRTYKDEVKITTKVTNRPGAQKIEKSWKCDSGNQRVILGQEDYILAGDTLEHTIELPLTDLQVELESSHENVSVKDVLLGKLSIQSQGPVALENVCTGDLAVAAQQITFKGWVPLFVGKQPTIELKGKSSLTLYVENDADTFDVRNGLLLWKEQQVEGNTYYYKRIGKDIIGCGTRNGTLVVHDTAADITHVKKTY